MPSCGSNCKIIRQTIGNLPPPTVLTKQTRKICQQCNIISVSEYSHNVCYNCAAVDTEEYKYHHSRCPILRQVSRL
jgi:hypothetical protein